MQNQFLRFVIAIFFLPLLVACEEEKAQEIVIPPGDQVQYTTDQFLYYSDDNYVVFLREVTDDNLVLKSVLDLTPGKDTILDPETIHSTIVPKGMTLKGFFVLQVGMEFHKTKLFSFVFDSEPLAPSLQSTLVYNVLSNYPHKSMKSYSRSQIEMLQRFVDKFTAVRTAVFGLSYEMNPDALYKFFQNGLSNNTEFFDLLETVGVEFDYGNDGEVLTAPFPFGAPNNPPELDLVNSTAPGDVPGIEQTTLDVTAQATDPDGDLLFYIWRQDGEIILQGLQTFSWTPGFNDGRAEPYEVTALISDGGRLLENTWQMRIQDLNRKPRILKICGAQAKEGVTYYCDLIGEDPDQDEMKWVLVDTGMNAIPTINGQPAPTELVADQVRIEWKPDNADAKKRTGYLEVRLDDGKLGLDVRGISLSVEDVNSPPEIVGGTYTPIEVGRVAAEWDSCLGVDPDGHPDPYKFKVTVEDPDNVAGATPLDELTVSYSGGGSAVSLVEEIVTATGGRVFVYAWRPSHAAKTINLVFQAKDDHNGFAPVTSLQVTAEDRNQLACLSGGEVTISGGNSTDGWTMSGVDQDLDIPLLESFDFPLAVYPLLLDCDDPLAQKPLALRQKFNETYLARKTMDASGGQCINSRSRTIFAGAVVLERAAPFASDITIPQGSIVQTLQSGSADKFQFEVFQSMVMEKDDRRIVVPVTRINASAPAGSVTVIQGASLDPSLAVTNPSVIASSDKYGYVTLSRSGSSGDLKIPGDTVLKTNSGFQTSAFKILYAATITDGSTSVSGVKIRRLPLDVASNTVVQVVSTLADASLTVANPVVIKDSNIYYPQPYGALGKTLGVDYFQWKTRAYDGQPASSAEISLLSSPLSDSTVTVSNPNGFLFDGEVVFSRPSVGSNVSIPLGFVVSTLNGKRYQTVEAMTMPATWTSLNVPITRVMDAHPQDGPQVSGLKLIDQNEQAKFVSGTSATVTEGDVILGYKIEVSDRLSDKDDPIDEGDRYTFSSQFVGQVPSGQSILCRKPATHASNINDPPCEPCASSAGLTHLESAVCYMRFFPAALDVSTTFQFEIESDDHGVLYPSGAQFKYASLSVTVVEKNDPPVATDSTFNPPPPGPNDGSSELLPMNLGAYVEGTESSWEIYAFDPDKGLDFKRVAFELDPNIYDIALGSWVPKPSTMTVSAKSFVQIPTGFGSQTTGVIVWSPEDEDVKRLSSDEGFVVKVRVYDAPSLPGDSKQSFVYYRMRVINRNNSPSVDVIDGDNLVNLEADSYFSTTITVNDIDHATPLSGSFTTQLTMCEDAQGTPLLHPTLDAPMASPIDCHATSLYWPEELMTYDPNYLDNSATLGCRQGAVLNDDLALPKLTRIGGPVYSGSKISYTYKLEWCPQKGQIGKHVAQLFARDNGDESRAGVQSLELAGASTLSLNVVSPVFFNSPRLDFSGDPEHYMKQTVGDLGAFPFVYKTIVTNSKGNPLTYSLVNSPRTCGDGSGNDMCIDASGVITWSPRLPDDLTMPSNDSTWHRVEVKVTDSITGENDQAHFFLQVGDPLSPLAEAPVVVSSTPSAAIVLVDEKEKFTFSLTATDANPADVLHYRWYVDDELMDDEGDSFVYKPEYIDGSVDGDGVGPLKRGEHEIKVEVTDGSFVTAHTWVADVRNIYMVPIKIFDVVSARQQTTPPATVENVQWSAEVGQHTFVSGLNVDYLYFTGQYTRGVGQKNYLWSLQFVDGTLSSPNGNLSSPPWNFYENLPWAAGQTSSRIAYKEVAGTTDIVVTPQDSRYGPFTSTSTSVKLRGDFTVAPIPLGGANSCVGLCSKYFYNGTDGYGKRSEVQYSDFGTHLYFAGDQKKQLLWDRNTAGKQMVRDFAPDLIWGIARNVSTKRLYVTTQNVLLQRYQLHVFDLTPAGSNSAPIYLSSIDVFDGVPGHVDSLPADMAVNEIDDKIYIWLAGTGGLAVLEDDGGGTPVSGDLSYLGVGQISPSQGDLVSSGVRLTYDPASDLIMGISRDSRQVFTIDAASSEIYIYSGLVEFDSIINYSESGSVVLIDRGNASVYTTK